MTRDCVIMTRSHRPCQPDFSQRGKLECWDKRDVRSFLTCLFFKSRSKKHRLMSTIRLYVIRAPCCFLSSVRSVSIALLCASGGVQLAPRKSHTPSPGAGLGREAAAVGWGGPWPAGSKMRSPWRLRCVVTPPKSVAGPLRWPQGSGRHSLGPGTCHREVQRAEAGTAASLKLQRRNKQQCTEDRIMSGADRGWKGRGLREEHRLH